MDDRLVKRIEEDWRLIGAPMRPDPAKVEQFRRALGGAGRVLVMGATPELIDMLVRASIPRISAMDVSPETVEAMRHLAQECWARVELLVGDWRVPRPDWRGAFDAILCDGGFNFLPFPEVWREVGAAMREQLGDDGRLVFSAFAIDPASTGFEGLYQAGLAAFDADRALVPPAEHVALFGRALSRLKACTLIGAVSDAGAVDPEKADRTARWMAADLRRRYPEPILDRVIEAVFDRPNPVGLEGARLIAAPSPAAAMAELRVVGLRPAILASVLRPPATAYFVAASRSV